MNFHFEILHVFCEAHQLFWKIWWNMHIDDAHDNKMVAEETALQVHTRAQSRAAHTGSIIEATSLSPSPEPTVDPINQPTESVMPTRSARASTRATNEISIIYTIFLNWQSHELSSNIQLNSFCLYTTNLMLLEKCVLWVWMLSKWLSPKLW